jgi:hypothetical protein
LLWIFSTLFSPSSIIPDALYIRLFLAAVVKDFNVFSGLFIARPRPLRQHGAFIQRSNIPLSRVRKEILYRLLFGSGTSIFMWLFNQSVLTKVLGFSTVVKAANWLIGTHIRRTVSPHI